MGKYDQYAGEDLDVPLYEGQGSSSSFSKITSDAANGLGSFGLGFSMGHNAVNGIVAPILVFPDSGRRCFEESSAGSCRSYFSCRTNKSHYSSGSGGQRCSTRNR